MTIYDIIFPKPKEIDPLNDLRGIVYCIENRVNGMKYIGMTKKTFCGRYSGGRWWANTHNKQLLGDYTKYGINCFSVRILEHGLKEDELPCVERDYIYHFDTFCPNGYNMIFDTSPLSSEGEIYRADIKRGHIARYQKEPSDGYNKWHFGSVSCSEETKRKISLANKGKKRTPEQRERIGVKARGRKHTPEAIAIRSLALKGKHTKAVLQIDPKTNNVVCEHASLQEAAASLGLASSANLGSVCKGKQKTAGGYIFRYKL